MTTIAGLSELPRGATIWASVSGGKDSTAMCLALREAGIEHRRIFADTGWEHPETYAYLDRLERVSGACVGARVVRAPELVAEALLEVLRG